MVKILLPILVLFLSSCFTNRQTFYKSEKARYPDGKVFTFPLYDLNSQLDDQDDPILELINRNVSRETALIFGSIAVNRETFTTSIQKSPLKNHYPNFLKEIGFSIGQNSNLPPEIIPALKEFSKEIGVEMVLFPFISGNFFDMKQGEELRLTILLYDSQTGEFQYSANLEGIKIPGVILEANLNDEEKILSESIKLIEIELKKFLKQLKKDLVEWKTLSGNSW